MTDPKRIIRLLVQPVRCNLWYCGIARPTEESLKLLDKLNIAETDVVGWSGGGIIGLDLAMHHPERVKRLVVFGATYDVDGLDMDRCPISSAEKENDPARDFYKRVAPIRLIGRSSVRMSSKWSGRSTIA